MPRCQSILTSTGVFSVCHVCQSVLILWHFDCSLDFFNFSLRGTKIHPKKPAFLRPIKSFIFLKYMPRLHLLPSGISKFFRGVPQHPLPMKRGDTPSWTRSRLRHSGICLWHVQSPPTKILHLLLKKKFWEPWVLGKN